MQKLESCHSLLKNSTTYCLYTLLQGSVSFNFEIFWLGKAYFSRILRLNKIWSFGIVPFEIFEAPQLHFLFCAWGGRCMNYNPPYFSGPLVKYKGGGAGPQHCFLWVKSKYFRFYFYFLNTWTILTCIAG